MTPSSPEQLRSTISVVVPTLNEEKLLGGMLRQFSPAVREEFGVEVIVSDGGSTDRTLQIAREGGACVVENSAGIRQTISLGRNLGASQARGAILVFLNADTLFADPRAFFARITDALRDPGIVALTCSVQVFPHERRASDRWFHGFFNWLFSMMNHVGLAMGRGECHVIRSAPFHSLGGYATGITAGEDYDMFRRLAPHGRIRFLRDLVVYESPRRYRQIGYWHVMGSWFVNWLFVSLLHRSVSDEWRAIR